MRVTLRQYNFLPIYETEVTGREFSWFLLRSPPRQDIVLSQPTPVSSLKRTPPNTSRSYRNSLDFLMFPQTPSILTRPPSIAPRIRHLVPTPGSPRIFWRSPALPTGPFFYPFAPYARFRQGCLLDPKSTQTPFSYRRQTTPPIVF